VKGGLSMEKLAEGNAQFAGIKPEKEEPAVCEVYLDGELKKAEVIDESDKSYGIFMHSVILSNNSQVIKTGNHEVKVIGDEQEKAISLFTLNKGFDKSLFDSIAPKIAEVNLENEICLKPSVHLINNKLRIVTKGNTQQLLQRCSYVLIDSKFVKLTRRMLRSINEAYRTMVEEGLKVYAVAIKDLARASELITKEFSLNQMVFVGLLGIGKA
jgi:magnesium-transporting ATPase (P-type)